METQNAPFITRRDAVASVGRVITSIISTAVSCLPANQLIVRRAEAVIMGKRVRIFLPEENSIGKTSLTQRNKASSGTTNNRTMRELQPTLRSKFSANTLTQ